MVRHPNTMVHLVYIKDQRNLRCKAGYISYLQCHKHVINDAICCHDRFHSLKQQCSVSAGNCHAKYCSLTILDVLAGYVTCVLMDMSSNIIVSVTGILLLDG